MLKEMIGSRIQIVKSADTWQEAVKLAAQPLLKDACIREEYVDAMMENIRENGAYVIIVPGFAMPHARPECGVLKTGMSFLGLEKPVKFPEDKEVKVMIALAAENPDLHLEAMSELAEILMDDEKLEELFALDSAEKVKEFFRDI